MTRIVNDLQKFIASALTREACIAEHERPMKEAKIALELKDLAKCLRDGPTKDSLLDKLITPLYKDRCGALQAWFGACRGHVQNLNEVWVIACQALEEKIVAFLARRTDTDENTYPQLWELLSAAQDTVLNSLPEMAVPPENLMQMLTPKERTERLLVAGLRRPWHRGQMSLCEGWFAWSFQEQTYLTDS